MANVTETVKWEPGVYQLEVADPVQGGPDGVDNRPHKQLANRTAYLKQFADEVTAARGGKASLDNRLDQYDTFKPEEQSNIVAGIQAAMNLAGVNARSIETIRKRVLRQGTVTIKNKMVLNGFILTKSDIRALHLSATGTVGTGVSMARVDGVIASKADDDFALSVPTNETGAAKSYYAVLRKSGNSYALQIVGKVPDDALLLYALSVPAGDKANNLNKVTLTDRRVVQTDNAWISTRVPFAAVAFAESLPAAGYAVNLETLSATDVSAVGTLTAYDKAVNGFKIKMTGSADNVRVRWTLLNPSYK